MRLRTKAFADSLAQETIVIQLPTECNSAFTAKKEGVALFRARLSVRRIEPCAAARNRGIFDRLTAPSNEGL